MVGHALMRGKYRYYRCIKAYGDREPRCSSRYVRVNTIEQVVLDEIAKVLTDPELVMGEARRLNAERAPAARLARLHSQSESIQEKQRRLVRLYSEGYLPDDILEGEAQRLNSELNQVNDGIAEAESRGARAVDLSKLRRQLPEVLQTIRDWVNNAKGDDLSLLLNALQVQIHGSTERVSIEGVIPLSMSKSEAKSARNLVTIERTSA
jgi:hypothetical protein